MHLDAGVIERAEALLSAQERDYERALAELALERTRTTNEREALANERAQLRALEDGARKRIEALERERRELAQRAEAQLAAGAARRFPPNWNGARPTRGERSRGPRVTRGQSELLGRTIDDMRTDLGISRTHRAAPRPDAQAPAPIARRRSRAHHLARHRRRRRRGLRQRRDDAARRRCKMTRAEERPRSGAAAPAPQRAERSERESGSARLAAATSARTELDVRGKRFVEAEPVVEQWIDESMLAGASPLRLIHGKGTGLLAAACKQYLRAHPHVQRRALRQRRRRGQRRDGVRTGVTMTPLRARSARSGIGSPTAAITSKRSTNSRRARRRGKRLNVKLGLDPTTPDLHIGHAVVLRKLQQFVDARPQRHAADRRFHRAHRRSDGPQHDAPAADRRSDRSQHADLREASRQSARPRAHHAALQLRVARQALVRADSSSCSRKRRSRRCSIATIFAHRYAAGTPISMHEFLYPVAQAYDSVALEADVELGGSDQLFNLLMGRPYQRMPASRRRSA